MEITIPLGDETIRVDPNNPTYEAEVLAHGFAYLTRVSNEVVLAIMHDNGNLDIAFRMPRAIFDWFSTTQFVRKEEGSEPEPATDNPQPRTPEEAADYIANWREKGWKKPGGHIYQLAKKRSTGARVAKELTRR